MGSRGVTGGGHGVLLAEEQKPTLWRPVSWAAVRCGWSRSRPRCVQAYRSEILLRADEGDTDPEIADELGVHVATVRRTRRRFVEEGLQATLVDKPRPGAPPKMDGKQEAMVIALACSEAPEGHAHWNVGLLARAWKTSVSDH